MCFVVLSCPFSLSVSLLSSLFLSFRRSMPCLHESPCHHACTPVDSTSHPEAIMTTLEDCKRVGKNSPVRRITNTQRTEQSRAEQSRAEQQTEETRWRGRSVRNTRNIRNNNPPDTRWTKHAEYRDFNYFISCVVPTNLPSDNCRPHRACIYHYFKITTPRLLWASSLAELSCWSTSITTPGPADTRWENTLGEHLSTLTQW